MDRKPSVKAMANKKVRITLELSGEDAEKFRAFKNAEYIDADSVAAAKLIRERLYQREARPRAGNG